MSFSYNFNKVPVGRVPEDIDESFFDYLAGYTDEEHSEYIKEKKKEEKYHDNQLLMAAKVNELPEEITFIETDTNRWDNN